MRTLSFLFLFCFSLYANDTIVVQLSTQQKGMPLYIAPWKLQTSSLDKKYVATLEKLLRSDFELDGRTEIVNGPECKRKLEASIKDKKLALKLSLNTKSKGLEDIILSGDLAQDRKIIHEVHDALFEALYQEKGIASTHVLYTVRQKKSASSSEWVSEVWMADYDGANAKQITKESSLVVTPTFIPSLGEKCREFLFVCYKMGQPKIYAANLSEGAPKRLTFLKGNQLMPAISPTLDKVAFISDITGNPDLFVQDFSLEKGLLGKPRQVFSAPDATQGTPSFSPDGKQLAFVSNKDGTPRIYIFDIPEAGVSIKSLNVQMITKKTRENTCPAWSPDGTKIAYSASLSGTRQIFIYDLVNKTDLQLTEGAGHKENPTWAPNSLHLMFNLTHPDSSELYLMNLNQKKAVKISHGPGEKRFPAWECLCKSFKG